MISIACSNNPFKLETDEDEIILFSFLGQVRDSSLSDSPLGQNNPVDKALRGGDLYTLPSIKTNVGYSFLDRAEEEYEPWALH
jgi:hypothetical protein